MRQKLITDIHKDVIELNTQEFHPKKYIRRRVIRKNLPRLTGLVLDIGCGRGEDPPFMVNARRIIGYDLDAEILKYYSERNSTDAVSGNAASMPFKDSSIDSLSCVDVLEHIPDYKQTLREMFRIIKKNGVLVISVPTDPSLFSDRDREIGHQRLFVPEALIDDIKSAGFDVMLEKRYGSLIYPYVKYVSNRMSVGRLHDMQRRKSFAAFKVFFNIFVKAFLNLDYYMPQTKDVGILIVAKK